MTDVVIIGAGGHGKVVAEILQAAGRYAPAGFIDADPSLSGTTVFGLPVLGPFNALLKLRGRVKHAIVAIGDNRARCEYARKLKEQGFDLINAIHPSAVVAASARLGQNVVIAAGAVVGTEARVADSAIINTSAVVDHECEIGEGAHICPGTLLAGRVKIGPRAFVGLGSRVLPCLSVGEDAIVGAGAVVIRDVIDGMKVVGVPARPLPAASA